MAWAGDWGRGDMLEEVEDTELKSPKRSRPAWADADTGVATAGRNGLRTSPFSSWENKVERDDEIVLQLNTSLWLFSTELTYRLILKE